jgi:hypothetical protein
MNLKNEALLLRILKSKKRSFLFFFISVDCSTYWADSVDTGDDCVGEVLLLNGWMFSNESLTLSPDDQRARLITTLSQVLNGLTHTFVELSSR